MNRLKDFLLLSIISISCLTSATFVSAQVERKLAIEPSYDLILQLIVGSNDPAVRGDLPQNFGVVSRDLKNIFTFSNYRVAATFIGRIANTGSFEYKSVSDIFGQESSNDSRTFLDWSVGGLTSFPDASGQISFQAQTFRFGARVPVKTGQSKNTEGQMVDIINYGAVGLNMNRISLSGNKPTLIGTLSLPKANGTIFLIMTIKAVEN